MVCGFGRVGKEVVGFGLGWERGGGVWGFRIGSVSPSSFLAGEYDLGYIENRACPSLSLAVAQFSCLHSPPQCFPFPVEEKHANSLQVKYE